MQFYTYPLNKLPDLEGGCVLTLDGEPLSVVDGGVGLILIDATWRYAEKMLERINCVPGLIYRSLPRELRTVYPRKQADCLDPERGLASVEALYAAYRILGRDSCGILDDYYWREAFLQLNEDILP